MSTLIPSITSCKFDTPGERRFARLLEAKLEDDYLCWYNVPIGPSRLHPTLGKQNQTTNYKFKNEKMEIL
jgi:hypothetical protein